MIHGHETTIQVLLWSFILILGFKAMGTFK